MNISGIKSILLQALTNLYTHTPNRSGDATGRTEAPTEKGMWGPPWGLRQSRQAPSSCVILHKLLDYSKMQFPHQKFPPPNVTVRIK